MIIFICSQSTVTLARRVFKTLTCSSKTSCLLCSFILFSNLSILSGFVRLLMKQNQLQLQNVRFHIKFIYIPHLVIILWRVLITHTFYNIEFSKSNSITFFQNRFVNEFTSMAINKMIIQYCYVNNVFKHSSP